MSYQKALAAQHRSGDGALAGIERAVRGNDWVSAAEAAAQFVALTETHLRFEKEDSVLYPIADGYLAEDLLERLKGFKEAR